MSQRDQSKSRTPAMAQPCRGWARIETAAKYADVEPRTVRDWLKEGLKHARKNQKMILIEFDAIDEFLKKFIVDPTLVKVDLNKMADDAMSGLNKPTRQKAAKKRS